jgi:curli biogenesis system outer membrane secretion channel CsgG
MRFAVTSVFSSRLRVLGIGLLAAALLAGCDSMPKVGGSAAGATAQKTGQLERCDKPLGTVAIVEQQNEPWFRRLHNDYKLESTVPLLRLMVQQSNCFVVVERGRAMNNMMQERALEQSGEMRSGSSFGKGQMVSADYSLTPSINFSENTGGGAASLAGLLPGTLGKVGALAGNVKFKEASTTLLMVDNRSGVQLAAAEGQASKTDFGAWGGLFGGAGAAGLGGYTKTPEGKVIAGAFADAYNQMVIAVRNYKPQEIAGGLGKGGAMGVEPAAAAPAPAKAAAPAPAPAATSGPKVEYSADQVMETADGSIKGRVNYAPGKERREMLAGGKKMTLILRHDLQRSWMLMHDDRMYMDQDIQKAPAGGNVSGHKIVERTRLGQETVNGISATKSKVVMQSANGERMTGFFWNSREDIVVKMDISADDSKSKTRVKMELSNLKVGKQDAALFEIPPDYAKMEMPSFGSMMQGLRR